MHNLKRILSCVVTVCLTLALLLGLTQLSVKKDSYAKHAEFFDQQEAFDVMFIGASPIMNGVLPMELWNNRGIVSYNMAQAGHPLPANYWVMRMALEEKVPELVVIDCFRPDFDIKTSSNYSLMHISLDSFPLSRTKIEAVYDLLDDPHFTPEMNIGEARSAINMLWNFSVFHARWDSLTEEDFHPQKSYARGAKTNTTIFYDEMEKISPDEKLPLESVSMDYLRRMIDECQSQGIEVLLITMPYAASAEDQMYANYISDVADEYGVNYINFLQLDLINHHIDMADNNSHMNLSGARKLTDYLGEYIQLNYGIADRRNDSRYADWAQDYEMYCGFKNQDIVAQTELYNLIMLLYGDGLDAVMYVKDKTLYKDSIVMELLSSLSVDTDSIDKDTDLVVIRNGGEYSTVLNNFSSDSGVHTSPAGNVSLHNEDGGMYISLDNSLRFPIMENADASLCILRNGELVDCVGFNFVYDEASGHIQQSETIR